MRHPDDPAPRMFIPPNSWFKRKKEPPVDLQPDLDEEEAGVELLEFYRQNFFLTKSHKEDGNHTKTTDGGSN